MTETTFDPAALLDKVVAGRALAREEAARVFGHIVAGEVSPIAAGALLAALQTRGLQPAEVAGGVQALRAAMMPVAFRDPAALVDTCGTGGGAVSTFNISTAAAFVAAGAGIPIAKHGNRSFTSKCGSADVLEALGAVLALSPAEMATVLEDAGIVFMFAPLLHPAMRHVAPVRRALGITTIMNLLGPLTNPAGARRQVVGVADPAFLELVVRSLAELGHHRALVVHGEPGLDEISPCGPTRVAELRDGSVSLYTTKPEELGLEAVAPEALAGGEPEENAGRVRAVLDASERGAPRSAVLVNAAAAIFVGGGAASLAEGARAAAAAIDSGRALASLDRMVAATRRARTERHRNGSHQ